MKARRTLIVNADDFGFSAGVNRGVISAYERGIVTAASLMVRSPAARDAAAYVKVNGGPDLGLHFDLGEWVYREGAWEPLYEVTDLRDPISVSAELHRQLAVYRDLLGKDPTHLDSHQHVHLREPALSVLLELAGSLGVPLRRCSADVQYCGNFYGQTEEGSPLPDVLTVDGLIRILSALPPGITELACHPGEGSDPETMYNTERAVELQVLCDPRVRAAVEETDIELSSFDKIRDRRTRTRS
jgi:chitin disaccharide deacetylase